jgi:hypothetical protein
MGNTRRGIWAWEVNIFHPVFWKLIGSFVAVDVNMGWDPSNGNGDIGIG